MPARLRARLPYVALAVATIALGLLVHLRGGALDASVRDVLGDVLWAAMIAWWIGALAPTWLPASRGGLALAVCLAVELSQRVHTPALDALRRTTVGHLVLGSDFDPRDLAAYAAGVLAAVLLDRAMGRRRARS
jgi:hypothetical protein